MLKRKKNHHSDKTPHHTTRPTGHKKLKVKISPFYRVSLFLFLVFFITLSYFVVLVSTTPKSFPFVTKKIHSYLVEKLGDGVSIEESHISFTRYGTLKVAVDNLRILHATLEGEEKQAFVLPKIETEFSLFNFLILNFNPSKVKIIDSEIAVNSFEKVEQIAGPPDDLDKESANQTALISGLFAAVKEGKLPIKNFEIENAKLLIHGRTDTKILIKKSQIRTSSKGSNLHILAINQLSFSEERRDVNFNSDCQLYKDDSLKCDLTLTNFEPASIVALHPDLKPLDQIDSALNATASFTINDGKLHNLLFKAKAEKGSFDFPDFFGQKMDFSDFSVTGEYDTNLGVLNLSDIRTDFEVASNDQIAVVVDDDTKTPENKAHLGMTLLISNLKNPLNSQLDFYIKLQNLPNDEMEKFWPKYLHDAGVRKWVIEHVNEGLIKDAYATFTLKNNNAKMSLERIDAKVVFSGLRLKYSADFPEISDVEGVANFTQNDMKISVNGGSVLGSKISDAQVSIDSFHSSQILLNIAGKSNGIASDSLKHASNSSSFASTVEKYLNGNSQNQFDIRIPLNDNLKLQDAYISVDSVITNLSNDFVKGGVIAQSKKDFGSNDFVTTLDLTASEVALKAFDIEKKYDVKGGLDLVISIPNSQKIALKNISLWKKDLTKEKTSKPNSQAFTAKISGSADIDIEPFLVTNINLRNDHFGANNYSFSYSVNKKTSSEKISLKAQTINLASFLQNKIVFASSGKKLKNSDYNISAKNIQLINGKSLKNFSLLLGCENSFCGTAFVKGNYDKTQNINLQSSKKLEEDGISINGSITDIGYLAEGLGISDKISGGDAKIKMTNKMVAKEQKVFDKDKADKKDDKAASKTETVAAVVAKEQVLSGEITLNNNITIFESAAVKKLSTNTLFSEIKDKIFSSEKIIFDSVKLEFDLKGDVLNLKSLIANNYKIGITAKGPINLKDDSYEIRGMIVPGFIINNLFGIGKIPILGGVISGLLTGGEGGGLFGIRYEYIKKKGQADATFETNKVSAFVPTTIRNLFDAI